MIETINDTLRITLQKNAAQQHLTLRPGQKLSVYVLRNQSDGVSIVRYRHYTLQVRSNIALPEGAHVTLQVASQKSPEGATILQLVPARVTSQGTLSLHHLDLASLLAIASHDEKLKKELKKQIDPGELAQLLDHRGAKLAKAMQKVAKHKKIQELFLQTAEHKGFEKETIAAMLDYKRLLRELRSFKEELGTTYMDMQEGLQTFWLASLIAGLYSVSLPLQMENLEENSIAFKKFSHCNFCRIALRFSDIGYVAATLIHKKRSLSIYFAIEDEAFRQSIAQERHRLAAAFAKSVCISVSPYYAIATKNLLGETLQDVRA